MAEPALGGDCRRCLPRPSISSTARFLRSPKAELLFQEPEELRALRPAQPVT